LADPPVIRVKRVADERLSVTRIAEPMLHPNENLVDVNYHLFVRDLNTDSVKELRETHVMRYFFKPEIKLLADQSGLKIGFSGEWLTNNPIGQGAWNACFCLLLEG
jgi:hypothetical protein